ncbi:MAG: CRISPR-associated protein Csx3, partial [Clostridia bacterium]|nr:CRISPR-associated protein Csx3 [Clostridia bacterium]
RKPVPHLDLSLPQAGNLRLSAAVQQTSNHALWSGRVVIDLESLYNEVAKLDQLPVYVEQAVREAGDGNEVVITGRAPVWLYLAVAHALHGKARRVLYASPVTGEVTIFDHSAE